MRKSRLTARRKRELKKSLFIKPLIGLYLLFLFLSSIAGSTEAAFNDVEEISASLKVGWELDEDEKWDKSSLTFDGQKVGGNCDRIYAYVKNGGDGDMEVPWGYQVIKISQGNDGDVIHEGETPLIDSGDSAELAYEGELENGKYKFKFVRPEGHPGGDSGGFSGKIHVTDCADQEEPGEDKEKDSGSPDDVCDENHPGNPQACDDSQQTDEGDGNHQENVSKKESNDSKDKSVEEKQTKEKSKADSENMTEQKEKAPKNTNSGEEQTTQTEEAEDTKDQEKEEQQGTNSAETESTNNKENKESESDEPVEQENNTNVDSEEGNTENSKGDNDESQDN
ncbi:amyloid fiber anchoring/assembly protein TapA [Piscibacillus salipiscarius]|uniref:Amyloid fiber anchoring/assembly protein TapA n=1 Tax=Piscibacillus salipiscarius TaxID=299480 RepID=A0ABW5QAX5_9BACI|nr:amyloid fiber anchoring/assembly protein TapA [Piscibacillus salipiscarius]